MGEEGEPFEKVIFARRVAGHTVQIHGVWLMVRKKGRMLGEDYARIEWMCAVKMSEGKVRVAKCSSHCGLPHVKGRWVGNGGRRG